MIVCKCKWAWMATNAIRKFAARAQILRAHVHRIWSNLLHVRKSFEHTCTEFGHISFSHALNA